MPYIHAVQNLACNRTYEGLYGRILSAQFPSRVRRDTYCEFRIQVPDGKFVSVYFGVFGIYSRANCTSGSMEVINLFI